MVEDGAEDGNRGLRSDVAIDRLLWCVRSSVQMSTTKIVNAIIDDCKQGRLNPNINF
jgi:hypothetical protein